jgi:hypothetical protein
MASKQTDFAEIHDAILDLTRVSLAVSGKFATKAEAIRKLAELSIPPSRIAAILAMPLPHVTSALSKARKNEKKKGGNGEASPPTDPAVE